MFKYLKLSILSFCCLLFACNTIKDEHLLIDFSVDSSAIVITNITPSGLLQLKNHLETDSAYQKLVTVLQTPTDNDSTGMEINWPGKLFLKKDQLVFSPDTPFAKGKSYLVETILNSRFASAKEILKSEVGHAVKSQQQILKR